MAATSKRDELIHLLLETANDDDLVGTVEEFLEPLRPPTFLVTPEELEIVEKGWSGKFTWSEMTTGLAELGYAFGDVVVSRDKNWLRRVISIPSVPSDIVWITSTTGCPSIIGKMCANSFRTSYSKYQTAGADVQRLSGSTPFTGEYGTDVEAAIARLENKIKDTPRFPTEQTGLRFQTVSGNAITLSWDDMTTRLAERGLAFGDVVSNEREKRLHRVVAFTGERLWITSSKEPDKIIWDSDVDSFEKYEM